MQIDVDFEKLVENYYAPLYRFAHSLTHSEADSCDLVQETFAIWATRGHQLRDLSKVKSWLFTTLHRRFLESHRRITRFPHFEISAAQHELPNVDPDLVNHLDAQSLLLMLSRVDALFRAPVALFYIEDYSYNEIAEILEVPLGTVKSRIARGLTELKGLFLNAPLRQATKEMKSL
jgi:RNA polymerase sigma-70 factor (ECF subfamily)